MLCVAWVNSLTVSERVNIAGSVSIGNFSTRTFSNGTLKTVFTPSANVTVTPQQSSIVVGGAAGQVLIAAYTIAATESSKGFYFMNIQGLFPVGCDDEFRFAVGYTFTDANKRGEYFPLPKGYGKLWGWWWGARASSTRRRLLPALRDERHPDLQPDLLELLVRLEAACGMRERYGRVTEDSGAEVGGRYVNARKEGGYLDLTSRRMYSVAIASGRKEKPLRDSNRFDCCRPIKVALCDLR